MSSTYSTWLVLSIFDAGTEGQRRAGTLFLSITRREQWGRVWIKNHKCTKLREHMDQRESKGRENGLVFGEQARAAVKP